MQYNIMGPRTCCAPCAAGLSGFWDDLTGAGKAVGGAVLDAASEKVDAELVQLKATLASTALLSFIGAATGTILLIRALR